MKLQFFAFVFFLMLNSANLFAQKPITPDVEGFNLHLSDYKDLDACIKSLLKDGYTKIDWPSSVGKNLLSSVYKQVADSTETILEIIHNDKKAVFEVNLYFGYTAKIWASKTDKQKMIIATNFFFTARDLINKEFGANEKGQRKIADPYKSTGYTVPADFVKGMKERKLGYFANWGPFNFWPIEVESYNDQYIMIKVADPKASYAYHQTTIK